MATSPPPGSATSQKFVTAVGQTLDCPAFLHGRGVAHLDVKPDDVLLKPTPYFKAELSDFAISKVVTEATWLQPLAPFAGRSSTWCPRCFPLTTRLTAHGPPVAVSLSA